MTIPDKRPFRGEQGIQRNPVVRYVGTPGRGRNGGWAA